MGRNQGPLTNFPFGLGEEMVNHPPSKLLGTENIGNLASVIGGGVDRTVFAQSKRREIASNVQVRIAKLRKRVTGMKAKLPKLRGQYVTDYLGGGDRQMGNPFPRLRWGDSTIVGSMPSVIGILSGPTRTVLGQRTRPEIIDSSYPEIGERSRMSVIVT